MFKPFLRTPWILGAFCTLGLCAVANIIAPPWHPTVVDALRSEGYATSFAETVAASPQFPDDENAALVFRHAAEQIKIDRATHDSNWSDQLERTLAEDSPREMLTQLVSMNAETLRLAESARDLPGGCYPLGQDNWYLWLDERSDPLLAERLAKLLRIAAITRAYGGDLDGAVRAVETMRLLSESLANTGHPEYRRYAALHDARILETIRVILEGFNLDGSVRARLAELLNGMSLIPEAWTLAMVAEMPPGILYELQHPYFSVTPDRHVLRNMHIGWPQEFVLRALGVGHFGAILLALSMDDVTSAAQRSPFEIQDWTDRWLRDVEPSLTMRGGVQSVHLTYEFHNSFHYAAQRAQLAGGLRLVLAVEAFRDAHGQIPDAVEELVPEYIDAIPPDYCAFLESRYVSQAVRRASAIYPFPPLRYDPTPIGYHVHDYCSETNDALSHARRQEFYEDSVYLNLHITN